MDSPLIIKSKQFALNIIKFCYGVQSEKHEKILTNQLIRSGTSVGANIREAFYACSNSDFVFKLQTALKECAESEYWLELLIESNLCKNEEQLTNQCTELKKLLTASIKTAKENNR